MIESYENAQLLVNCLRRPDQLMLLDEADWTALITMARAERLIGTIACLAQNRILPATVQPIIDDELQDLEYQHRTAYWEVECARRALESYEKPVVLMKGSAYLAAQNSASRGRQIGDLDIMVAEDDLKQVEALLLEAGWEWVKEDAYDDAYYREHMHELPPMIHEERDGMIDVHHTILPKTARPNPDPRAMIADAVKTTDGHYTFSPEDMVCHSAAHLMADGDLAGGLRNLWDIHCLLSDFSDTDESFWERLKDRATYHQLWRAVQLAAVHASALYGTEIPVDWKTWKLKDKLIQHRVLARNGWGQETDKLLRLLFYIRSHWMRMPPLMLAKHLFTKWRKGGAGPS